MEFTFETDRLGFRPWTMEDADACYMLARDPRVGPPCGWLPHQNVEETRGVLRSILINDFTFAVVEKTSGEVVGDMGLMPVNDENGCAVAGERELGFWLGYPYWERGYMTEAVQGTIRYCFSRLGLNRLWCSHYDGNNRSQRVQEKCGFRLHHRSIQFRKSLSREVEVLTNVLDRADWEKQNG